MSIYGSHAAPSDDEHEDGCAVYVETEPGCFDFSGDPCSCGQPDAPLVYQGSHVLPAETDERGGYVDIASIPGFITRDGRDDGPGDDATPWPFLRFGVNEGTVVLTRRNVEEVYATLGEWLASTTKHGKAVLPRSSASGSSPGCRERQDVSGERILGAVVGAILGGLAWVLTGSALWPHAPIRVIYGCGLVVLLCGALLGAALVALVQEKRA